MKRRPMTILLRAKTAAERKKIEDVEHVLSRNVGFPVKLSHVWTDKVGDEWRSTSWPMSSHDMAAMQMCTRRGKTPGSPAIATAADWHEKSLSEVVAEKKLVRKAK